MTSLTYHFDDWTAGNACERRTCFDSIHRKAEMKTNDTAVDRLRAVWALTALKANVRPLK